MGFVHSVESMGLVDGPGIRTVIFLQGCPLRCVYCHNPDTWKICDKNSEESAPKEQIHKEFKIHKSALDVNAQKGSTLYEYTPEELLSKILRFKSYFGAEGGVTFSGGEPLIQGDFLKECLKLCKENGINTCIDTSGVGNGDYEDILKYTDLILFDVKHFTREGYKSITGLDIDKAEEFLNTAQKLNVPLWIRHVVVPGLTDGYEHFKELGKYLMNIKNIRKVELLPYHELGVHKYEKMNIPYKLKNVPAADPEITTEWNERLNKTCVKS